MDHNQAREILRNSWLKVQGRAPSESELSFSQAVAWLETGYSRAGQFGKMAALGQYNWGAVQRLPNPDGSCPTGMTRGKDAGNTRCFYAFSSDQEAADFFLKTLTKDFGRSVVVQAMNAPATASAVAQAMKQTGYYEAAVSDYASAIQNALSAIGRNFPVPEATKGVGLLIAVMLGSGALAYWLTRNA
jgi:hypothetical protein